MMRAPSKLLCLALAAAVSIGCMGPLQTKAADASDPASRARFAAVAWVRGEYSHNYDGYNEIRADLLEGSVDPGVLETVVSGDEQNLAAWKKMVDDGSVTQEEVQQALAFLEKIAPHSEKWRLHDSPGENDGTHALMIGAAVIIAVAVVYVASGAPMPGSSPSSSNSNSNSNSNKSKKSSSLSSSSGGGHGGGGSASSHFASGKSYSGKSYSSSSGSSNGSNGPNGKSGSKSGSAEHDQGPDPAEQAAAEKKAKEEKELADKKAKEEKRKADLDACLAQAKSGVPAPFTYPFAVNVFARAKGELAMCTGPWTEKACMGAVLKALPDTDAMAKEVAQISKQYSKLGLEQSCPVPHLNAESLDDLKFWCKNTRKDCGPWIAGGEESIQSANTAAKCVWDADFYKSREDACHKQFDPKEENP